VGAAAGLASCMSTDAVTAELQDWLTANWDPDLTVAQWWERLGLSGWAAPGLPSNAYGKDLSRSDAVRVSQQIGAFGALPAPGGLGMLLAAPTIATHGTPEQIEEFVRPIVTGQRAWCQLFSEPGAGSDLAGLSSKAIADGEEWIVNGQKVWTSGGHFADMAMLIARTNSDAPKHQGISYFAIDMHQPGVDIRPLREMTGHALFNEVFMTDARVPSTALVGGLHNGWAVANTTLAYERSGLGAGGAAALSTAMAGTVAGHLERRVGDFVTATNGSSRDVAGAPARPASGAALKLFLHHARKNGSIANATVRQDLARLYTLTEIGRFNNERVKAARAQGHDIAGMANIGKLSMSTIVRLQRDLGLRILGPYGTLHAYTDEQRASLDALTGEPRLAMMTSLALHAQAPPIYGGTDQIQRNIIGERVLGLAKEPGNDSKVAFSSLPKNG
jgi:alkylation response protein AidB-like acyl-CoA dehydrogenase